MDLGYRAGRLRRQSDRILSVGIDAAEVFESGEARYAGAVVLWLLGVIAIIARKVAR